VSKQICYAVIGLGSIAQEAVLPAFQHAENSRLVALVSGDAQKPPGTGPHL
jgi:predicted dehydrogenase